MAVTVKFDAVDRTSQVVWDSFGITEVASTQNNRCSMTLRKYGATKTFKPEPGDVLLVEDGATTLFGGEVVRVNEVANGRLIEYQVQAVDYGRVLDRFLVADEYEGVDVGYVINDMFNEKVNTNSKILASFETGETWTDEAGTSSADTTLIRYRDQGRKFTAASASTVAARTEPSSINMNLADNSVVLDASDLITCWYHVDNATNLSSIAVRFGNESGGTYTNYIEYTLSSGFESGWNFFSFARSAFTETGTFDATNVDSIRLAVTASASGTVNVTFDDLRVIEAEGFTQNNVKGTEFVSSARFNYEQVSDCLTQLARVIGYEWYVDENKDLHFFAPGVESASFDLEDDNDSFLWNTLQIEEDIANMRNQIYVRGSIEVGDTVTEDLSEQADGSNKHFKLAYKYKNLTCEVNSSAQTLGIDFIDDPTAFDALHNFQEKVLKFDTAPASGATVEITGDPYIPIIVKKKNQDSIDQFGVFEFRIIDKSITSRQAARQRAQAELTAYREELTEGRFKTFNSGLKAGMQIRINSAIRGVDETYVINRVRTSSHTPSQFIYDVEIVSTRTLGIIEFLQELLRRDSKGIEISEDELIDLVESPDETITVTESASVPSAGQTDNESGTITEDEENYIDSDPTWVTAPYHPTSLALDRKRPAFADRDNLLGS